MMTRTVIAAGILTMLAGAAGAQPAPAAPNGVPPGTVLLLAPSDQATPPAPGPTGGPGPGPMGGQGQPPTERGPGAAQMERGPGMMSRGGPQGMERMMRMHPPKGAVFMFRRGDQRVVVKCADEESTKACVDAAGTLMDKLAGMQGNAPSAPH